MKPGHADRDAGHLLEDDEAELPWIAVRSGAQALEPGGRDLVGHEHRAKSVSRFETRLGRELLVALAQRQELRG